MERVDKVHRDARNPRSHVLFQDGLRTLFPACQGTLPGKMVRVLEQLDHVDTDDDERRAAVAVRLETRGQ